MQRKKMLVSSGIVLALGGAAAAASHIVTKSLVDMALDGKKGKMSGKSCRRVAGKKEEAKCDINAPEKIEKMEEMCEEIEIRGFDGERLVGHLSRCDNAKRVVVAMHGWRSSWKKDFGMIADFLHDNDCDVLYAEQRGQNNSGGKYMSFGLKERFDCLKWIEWINEAHRADLPIYLCGVSMGAATVLMTAGFELPDNVCGIVADCGYTSPAEVWRYVIEKNLKLNYAIRKRAIDRLCEKKLKMKSDEYSAVEAMKHSSVPVLFIHGTDDKFVPIDMTYENYKACTAPKKLFVVPGAEHGMSYCVDKAGYEEAVKKFWKECETMH